MKAENSVYAIISDNFDEKNGRVVDGHYCLTNEDVESALASVYVAHLRKSGIIIHNSDDEFDLIEKIRKSLLNYKSKAKKL